MTAELKHQKRWALVVLAAAMTVALVCVVYPIYVIRPFRAQGERELMAALMVTRLRPVLTVISALAALGAAIMYWRAERRERRALIAGVAGIVCVLALLARVNVYELMFHPIDRPSFAAASQVKLDHDEKVIAIKIGGKARAYPVRSVSYHHIVNDVVDSRAIVATY
jgi:hypothetical protein